MKYRADIGGLRALAIVSVILFHFKVPGFSGGFSGVDIFFVISGYLMSCIFLTKVELGFNGVLSFYKSRFIRIYPALISMILISYLALSIAGANGWMLDFYNEAKFALIFISNIFYSSHSGYFDSAADSRWLLHTWSLSVEWQFYMIFPLIVLAVTKAFNKDKVRLVYILLFLISLFLCLFIFNKNQNDVFYSLSSRAWELFAGALTSTLHLRLKSNIKKSIEVSGVLIILLSVLSLNNNNWPNVYTLLPVLGCSLVILSNVSNSKSLLRWWPLQKIGDISYSLYLWHWVVCAYMTNADINFSTKNISIAIFISTTAAVISYNYLERWKIGGVKTLAGSIVAAAVLMTIVNAHIIDSSKKITFFSSYGGKDLDNQFTHDCFITSGTKHYDEFKKEKCLKTSTTKQNILLFGDSHAAQLSSSLRNTLKDYNVMQATASGCYPYYGSKGNIFCTKLSSYIYDQFLSNNKVDIVIISAFWATDRFNEFNLIKPSIDKIKKSGAKVIIIGQTPSFVKPFPTIAMQTPENRLKSYLDKKTTDFYDSHEEKLSEYSDVYINAFTLNGESYFNGNGYPLFLDKDHLTPYGADIISKRIKKALAI